MTTVLSAEQKRSLYRDGYVVLKRAVSQDLVQRALDRIKRAKKGENLGPEPEMTDLVNASTITPILHDAMGYFDPPVTCQIGVRKQAPPGNHFNNLGYRDRDMPYYGAESHVDGSMTIRVPQEVQKGTEKEVYGRYIASGPKGAVSPLARSW